MGAYGLEYHAYLHVGFLVCPGFFSFAVGTLIWVMHHDFTVVVGICFVLGCRLLLWKSPQH